MYNNLVYSSDKPFGDLKIFDAFKSTLKYVDFSMNYISGSLSTAMMPKMEDVAYFDLSANMFSGEFPFSSMPASTDMLAFKIGAGESVKMCASFLSFASNAHSAIPTHTSQLSPSNLRI